MVDKRLVVREVAKPFDHGCVRNSDPEQESPSRKLGEVQSGLFHCRWMAQVDAGDSGCNDQPLRANEKGGGVDEGVLAHCLAEPLSGVAERFDAGRGLLGLLGALAIGELPNTGLS